MIDYSTWYDCCGFGFRHIISEREFTRSFAIDRKMKVAVEEAKADVMIGHDTGCITTLDKNQWIGKLRRARATICRFWPTASSPPWRLRRPSLYKIVQSHWHASSTEELLWRNSASTGRRPEG